MRGRPVPKDGRGIFYLRVDARGPSDPPLGVGSAADRRLTLGGKASNT